MSPRQHRQLLTLLTILIWVAMMFTVFICGVWVGKLLNHYQVIS